MSRVLVCGSRFWDDARAIYDRLARLPPDTCIVHGAARGADRLAGEAAERLGLKQHRYPAQWRTGDTYNPRAGFERTDAMLDSGVVLVLAFRVEGNSRGTDYTIAGARERGIPVEAVTKWPP